MKILLCANRSEANDYIHLLAQAYEKAGHTVMLGPPLFLKTEQLPDLVHVHWPEQFYKTHRYLPISSGSLERLAQRFEWFRGQGIPIVYTVHNLKPHESAHVAFERDIYTLFARYADVFIHHGKSSVKLLCEDMPLAREARHLVLPHGAYPAKVFPRNKAREYYRLPPSKLVVLNFGLQRAYKGPAFIAQAFCQLDRRDFHLFTLGPLVPRPRGWVETAGHRLLRYGNRVLSPLQRMVRGHTRYWRNVASSEVPCAIAASDIVMLGHQAGLNSGLLSLAASYAKPVVYPDIGNFGEQLDGWLWCENYTAGDVTSAVAALQRMQLRLHGVETKNLLQCQREWVAKHNWDEHVAALITYLQGSSSGLSLRI